MEALGLILAIKKIVVAFDDAATRYHDTHGSLAALRNQVEVLDGIAGRMQAWLDKASNPVKNQLSSGIDGVTKVAEEVVGQLDLDVRQIPTSSGSSDEAQLRQHLEDTRELISLVNFALAVCQLQDEQQRLNGVKELQTASTTLQNARQCHSHSERANLISEGTNRATALSPDFRAFMAELMAIESARKPDATQVAAGSDSPIPTDGASTPRAKTASAPIIPSGVETIQHQDNGKGKLAHRQVASQSSTGSSSAAVRSLIIPDSEEFDSYASSSSYVDQFEGTNSTGSPGQPRPGRAFSRKPVPSMASTMVATSPTQETDTIGPDKLEFHNPSGVAPDVDSGSASTPRTMPPPRTPDLKLGTLAEQDRDEAPPAYQEQAHSPGPLVLPSRLEARPEDLNVNHTDDTGRPYLIKSVQDNHFPIIQVLIERGADVEASDARTQRTAVMEAARLGREEITDLLLNGGCRLDRIDIEGNTVLHHAVVGGSTKIVQQLISTDQIDVNSRGQASRTPLHLATEFGSAKMVGTLIQGQADPSFKDESQRTPLHISAARGNVQMCEMLLDKGADADTYDRDGKTPLEVAALADRSAVVDLLLGRSAKSKANDPELLKGLYEAIKNGNVRMAQAIIAKGIKLKKVKEPWKPAALAAQSGNLDMLRLVIDSKGSLKEKNPEGWTPLHFAANLGYTAIAQRLLDEKVSPKATTKIWSETPLHMAISRGHISTADLLISNKYTDLQASDVDHNQPMHHAARLGLSPVVQALLAKGVKANTENKYGWRPIHLAAAYGHVTLASDLIGGGASIEDKLGGPSYKASKYTHEAIRRGYTAEARWPHPAGRPLALALEFGQDSFARMLLSHGAKTDGIDVHGWRPLHQAAFACNPEMVETLLQRGANPHATTNDNNTPLALGFRSAGLNASKAQKDQVRSLLQDAMFYMKPPKFDALRRGVSFGGNSASQRNQVWDTAETTTTLLGRHGSNALGEGESLVALDSLSGSGATPLTPKGDDSEEVSLRSSTTDPQREASPMKPATKRPSIPIKSPTTESASREDAALGQPYPTRSRAAELSSGPSVHRRVPELDGPEIVELGGSPRVAELGTQMPSPGALPAELP